MEDEGTEMKPLEEAAIINYDSMSIQSNGKAPLDTDAQIPEEEYCDERHLSPEDCAYYRFCALLIAWLSAVILMILAIFSFTASAVTGSSAAFGFGFDCILDVGTSLVVIWRFMGPVGSIYSEEKERMALNILGGFFILACLAILVRSVPELINAQIPEDSNWVLVIASVSSAVCFALAFAKFYLALKLDSQTLQSDGYSSLAGAITSLTWVISAFIIKENHKLWFVDDVVGICVALLLLYYGVSVIYLNLPPMLNSWKGQKDPSL